MNLTSQQRAERIALYGLLTGAHTNREIREQVAAEIDDATREACDLLRELTDPDACRYDHHGYCQAHSLHERPCPHERAKALLASAARAAASPTKE